MKKSAPATNAKKPTVGATKKATTAGTKTSSAPAAKKKPTEPSKGKKAAAAKNAAPSEPKKVEEEKKEEALSVENPVEEEKVIEPVKEPVLGSSIIKYNAYNQEFKHIDGVLKWADIDEEYCFSFAFKGDYQLKLRKPHEPDIFLECKDKEFHGLVDGVTYQVEIEEDKVAESKVEKRAYVPPS